MIELFDFRKADINLRSAGAAQLGNHLRKTVQRLTSEDENHKRGSLRDRIPFLARNAAAHSNDHVRPLRLQLAPFTEQGEDLLLRLLTHGARVHQQHVSLGRVVRSRKITASVEYVCHTSRIVLIHLAAKSLDEVTAGHRWAIREAANSKAFRPHGAKTSRPQCLTASKR